MVEKATLTNVTISVNGKTEVIKMEKGVSFENKGSIYTLDENSKLKRCDKKTNLWEEASEIKMTNYQWKAFQNVANNDGDAKSYTKADIEKAQELYRNAQFTADMSQDLPSGYKIEKPVLKSVEGLVQAYVTNGKDANSATLKFKIEGSKNAEIEGKANIASVEVGTTLQPQTEVQKKELERYGNFTVKVERFSDDDCSNIVKTTYSDGSYSEKRSWYRSYEYREYYSNGNIKFYESSNGDINSGYDYTIYDEKEKYAVLYDDSYEGAQSVDGIEDLYEYDSKGRITFDGHDWYKYDDKNKTVIKSSSPDGEGQVIKYNMDADGYPGDELSCYYLGETGKVINLDNDDDIKKLIKELKIREQ